jgi:nicotinamidase-related amidase
MTTTALVLVDVQRNMLEGAEPVPSAATVRAVLGGLLDNARAAQAFVVHVMNDGSPGDPDEPFTPGWELVFEPGDEEDEEIVVRKDQSDTFAANPGLADILRARHVERVVIAGMQSEFCIEATSRGALAEGFKVSLPRGAHATYDGDQSAGDVSAQTETTLESEGVDVVVLSEVEFA